MSRKYIGGKLVEIDGIPVPELPKPMHYEHQKTGRYCVAQGCKREHGVKGLCTRHYAQHLRAKKKQETFSSVMDAAEKRWVE